MRHKFLVLTVKKWLKSVYIYGSYRKIKTGVPLFLDHSVHVRISSWRISVERLRQILSSRQAKF